MSTRPFLRARPKRPRWWIAPPIEAWFRGERSIPITALSAPFKGQLEELWQAWSEVYPDARRPADWPTHRASENEQALGRTYLTRRKPRWYGPDARPRDVGRVG